MIPLEPGQLTVMRIVALVNALLLIGGGVAAEAVLSAQVDWWRTGALLLPLMLALGYAVAVAPGRRWRAWGYALGQEELRVARGVWTRVETHVPLARVQHVDVSQGPLERAFGVCRLLLNTAGTINAQVVLPGLSRVTAEAIRDEVRARIRDEDA